MTELSPHVPPAAAQPFAGQVVAFAGRLASVGRQEARGVVERLGGRAAPDVTARTTMLVVGAQPGGGSGRLRKAEAINSRAPGQVAIVEEQEFCRLAGLQSDAALRRLYAGARQMRGRYPDVGEVRLRHLEKWGLVRPVVRTRADTYFRLPDVAVVKRIQGEISRGGSFRGAVRLLLAAREGQMALDFRGVRRDAAPAKVVALARSPDRSAKAADPAAAADAARRAALAARFFREGSELDEQPGDGQQRAQAAYRKALLLDPALAPALVNLANIHYAQDHLVEAQALYERALVQDGDCFEAVFNLGNIHHDVGRYPDAVDYYRAALRLHPAHADAHFYLAVTLEKMGRSPEARPHWRTYRRLVPDGEWSELAREFGD